MLFNISYGEGDYGIGIWPSVYKRHSKVEAIMPMKLRFWEANSHVPVNSGPSRQGLHTHSMVCELQSQQCLQQMLSWTMAERFYFRVPFQEARINMLTPTQSQRTPVATWSWYFGVGKQASMVTPFFYNLEKQEESRKLERLWLDRSLELSKHCPTSGSLFFSRMKKKYSLPTLQPSCLQW